MSSTIESLKITASQLPDLIKSFDYGQIIARGRLEEGGDLRNEPVIAEDLRNIYPIAVLLGFRVVRAQMDISNHIESLKGVKHV